jgi:NADPH:quinone reductase-like Zn-dependent oxidoreductase
MIDDPETFDIVPFKLKSLSVHWELMFTRALYGTADMAEQHRILNEIADLVDGGVLRTTLREHYGPINAANLRRAHAELESGRAIGKVVLAGFTDCPTGAERGSR